MTRISSLGFLFWSYLSFESVYRGHFKKRRDWGDGANYAKKEDCHCIEEPSEIPNLLVLTPDQIRDRDDFLFFHKITVEYIFIKTRSKSFMKRKVTFQKSVLRSLFWPDFYCVIYLHVSHAILIAKTIYIPHVPGVISS